jgi:uncharacterized phage-associated protein
MKLVYIAHGWMLGLYGRPLIHDKVEAWRYGPVIPPLYRALKGYRDRPVREQVRAPREPFDEFESKLISQVFDLYGRLGGIQLSQITHQQDTPWYNAWTYGGQNQNISTDVIQDHYQRLSRERRPSK